MQQHSAPRKVHCCMAAAGVRATRLEARQSMLFGAVSGAAAETCVSALP